MNKVSNKQTHIRNYNITELEGFLRFLIKLNENSKHFEKVLVLI